MKEFDTSTFKVTKTKAGAYPKNLCLGWLAWLGFKDSKQSQVEISISAKSDDTGNYLVLRKVD